MASSGDSDYSEPPSSPSPPAGMIAPQGQSAPFSPQWINFLGDTNTPSTGLTPQMLAQINASNGSGQPPAQQGRVGGADIQQMNDLRNQLAAVQAAQARTRQGQQPMVYHGEGSAGGRGGSAGGGGWGGH